MIVDALHPKQAQFASAGREDGRKLRGSAGASGPSLLAAHSSGWSWGRLVLGLFLLCEVYVVSSGAEIRPCPKSKQPPIQGSRIERSACVPSYPCHPCHLPDRRPFRTDFDPVETIVRLLFIDDFKSGGCERPNIPSWPCAIDVKVRACETVKGLYLGLKVDGILP